MLRSPAQDGGLPRAEPQKAEAESVIESEPEYGCLGGYLSS